MKRLLVGALLAAAVAGGSSGAVADPLVCHQEATDTTAGCVYLEDANPSEAGAGGRVADYNYDIHLGWQSGVIAIGDCSPTHVGYCVPVPVLMPYEIHAIVAGTGLHAEGTPAPCANSCTYDNSVYVSHRPAAHHQVCYGADQPGVICG